MVVTPEKNDQIKKTLKGGLCERREELKCEWSTTLKALIYACSTSPNGFSPREPIGGDIFLHKVCKKLFSLSKL